MRVDRLYFSIYSGFDVVDEDGDSETKSYGDGNYGLRCYVS